jgi:plasmid stability protein
MVLLQIRNVPVETREELKRRAAKRGESMNSYLLRLLEEEVSTPTADEVFERAARRARPIEGVDIAALIREDRAEREEHLTRLFRK